MSEPTPGEVSRSLEQFREVVRDDQRQMRDAIRDNHRELSMRLDRTVSMDVYLADRRTDRERFAQLARELAESREAEDSKRNQIEQAKVARAGNRKWLIAAVIIPLGIGVVDLFLAIKGVR